MSNLFLDTRTLEHMREKPGMYFLPPLFPAFCNYVTGCHAALRDFAPQQPLCAELDGFDDWLCTRFQIRLPSFRWQQVVWERASEDHEQVRLFIDLFLAYRRQRAVDHPVSPLTT